MKLRLFGAAVLTIGLAWILLARPASVTRTYAGDSSCRACHEVEGKNPVSDKGEWHRQHSFTDMCSACHAGDAQAVEEAGAHVGVIKNPLGEAASTCSACHPEDHVARAEQYAALLSPAGTATLVPAPSLEATSAASPTLTSMATPSLLSPTAPPPAAAAPPSSNQPTVDWFAVLRIARGPLFRAAQW